MKNKILIIFCFVFIFTANITYAQNYTYAILGIWKTQLREKVYMYMAFSKNKNMEIIVKYSSGKTKSISRTYNVTGNKIYIKSNYSVLNHTLTILKLKKNVMILRNQAGKRFFYRKVIP